MASSLHKPKHTGAQGVLVQDIWSKEIKRGILKQGRNSFLQKVLETPALEIFKTFSYQRR